MLIFKPFFVHKCRNRRRDDSRRLRHAPRGFTVLVEPSGKERTLQVRLALCNYHDEFSKKEGRKFANVAPAVEINARDLVYYLNNLLARVYSMNPHSLVGEYDYVMRYIV